MAENTTIIWFRHDLRLNDHQALQAAISLNQPIIPLYILDQETPQNWRIGEASLWWLHHSLLELGKSLNKYGNRLILKKGKAEEIFNQLIKEYKVNNVFWNRCYEPYHISRDKNIKQHLKDKSINVKTFNGSLLFEPWEIKNKQNEEFKVFSPFWKTCLQYLDHKQPIENSKIKKENIPSSWPLSDQLEEWKLLPQKPNWAKGFENEWKPGEKGAWDKLKKFNDVIDTYKDDRNLPAIEGTSKLSPHLHYGEISPRQILQFIKNNHKNNIGNAGVNHFFSELGWREFSYHLIYHFPDFPDQNWRPQFNKFPWENQRNNLKLWQKGLTGYPIVDAGMRELWQTGWMHNRVRMIAASFLVKDLLIDWREGEKWFWDTLVDADLANNAAGWQWVAGSGADASPYFRIFNPILQGEKFDPDGQYVKKYIPELKDLPKEYIHKPWEAPESILENSGVKLGENYPKPIVDHDIARKKALDALKSTKED